MVTGARCDTNNVYHITNAERACIHISAMISPYVIYVLATSYLLATPILTYLLHISCMTSETEKQEC